MAQSDLSENEIERGIFLARYRVQLRIAGTLAIVVVIGFVLLVSANSYFKLISNAGQLNSLMSGLWHDGTDWQAYHASNAPSDIAFTETSVLAQGNNKYDIVVRAANSNKNWAVQSFHFEFVKAGQVIASGSDFLLPNEIRYIGAFQIESAEILNSVDAINVTSIKWRKQTTEFPKVWTFDSKPSYRAKQILSDGGRSLTVPASVTWTVTNTYLEAIRRPAWQIVLTSGNRAVAVVNYEASEDVEFLEKKTYEVSIFESLGRIDKAEVFPVIDYFDPETFYVPGTAPVINR